MGTNESTRLWEIADLMRYAGIKSRASIYVLIAEGLPVIKLGRLTRFQPDSVQEWIAAREVSR